MKDPGPNTLEQLIAANAKLAALAAGGGGASASSPGLYSLKPILHPAIFFDDASGTFNYTINATGEDYTADYDPASAFVGLKGITLKTKATTPAAGDHVWADMPLPLGPGPVFRVQLLMRTPATGSTNTITGISLSADDELNTLTVALEAHWAALKLAYQKKSNGSWAMTEMPDSKLRIDEKQWHTLDFAFNIPTRKWLHIILNGKTLSITADDVQATTSVNRGRFVRLRLINSTPVAEQAVTHLDQILITTEEA